MLIQNSLTLHPWITAVTKCRTQTAQHKIVNNRPNQSLYSDLITQDKTKKIMMLQLNTRTLSGC